MPLSAWRVLGWMSRRVPFFIATRPNWYRPLYPCYVVEENIAARRVLVAPGRMTGRSTSTEDDGPMLDLLKGFHQQTIEVPSRRAWKPNPEALAQRFERFSTLSR
jgi:hypothetical protein